MQRQHIDARAQPHGLGPLGRGCQKHVLRRRKTMHRRRVMLRQMIGVEPGGLQLLYLVQPLPVNLVQRYAGNGLNVVEYSKLQCHGQVSSCRSGVLRFIRNCKVTSALVSKVRSEAGLRRPPRIRLVC